MFFCRYFLLHSSNACSYFGAGIRTLFALCFCVMIGLYLDSAFGIGSLTGPSIVVFAYQQVMGLGSNARGMGK